MTSQQKKSRPVRWCGIDAQSRYVSPTGLSLPRNAPLRVTGGQAWICCDLVARFFGGLCFWRLGLFASAPTVQHHSPRCYCNHCAQDIFDPELYLAAVEHVGMDGQRVPCSSKPSAKMHTLSLLLYLCAIVNTSVHATCATHSHYMAWLPVCACTYCRACTAENIATSWNPRVSALSVRSTTTPQTGSWLIGKQCTACLFLERRRG